MKGQKWDKCNSIINKIYFLKKKKVPAKPRGILESAHLPVTACLTVLQVPAGGSRGDLASELRARLSPQSGRWPQSDTFPWQLQGQCLF